MLKKFNAFILISFVIFGCSKDEVDSPNDPGAQEPEGQNLLITKIFGADDAEFKYENGLLIKGVGNSSSDHDDYYSAFEVNYNENKQVESLILDEAIFIPKPTDFSFDLTAEDKTHLEIHNYNYSNGKLVNITSESGKLIREFEYNNNGQVIEETIYDYLDRNERWMNYKYFYEDGNLVSYTRFDSYNNSAENGIYKTDEGINPLFVFWNNHHLIIPGIISGISAYNLPFYPNNITERSEDGDIKYKARFDYDEEYPVYYEEVSRNDGGATIEYLE